jgi:hypothetical protein
MKLAKGKSPQFYEPIKEEEIESSAIIEEAEKKIEPKPRGLPLPGPAKPVQTVQPVQPVQPVQLKLDPSIRSSLSQNYNDIMSQNNRFGSMAIPK